MEIHNIPKKNIPIVGGDINARIGNRSSHPKADELYFGPWGDDKLNEAGTKVVPLMQRCALRAVSTFFQHKKYWTFKCNLQNKFKTLDHFLTHVRLSENIIDAKRIIGGPPSDHDPVILRLEFHSKKKKNGCDLPTFGKSKIAWNKLDDPDVESTFCEIATKKINLLISQGIPSAKAFSKAIVEAAESACVEDDPAKSGWFADGRTILNPLMEARNAASEIFKELPSEATKDIFDASRRALKKATTKAKHRSEFKKAIAIMKMMKTKPRDAWKKMRDLQAGHNSHHKNI